jgi:hypothetical protein
MRWKYPATNMKVEVAGVILQVSAQGLLPSDLPAQVHATCEESPMFTLVPDPPEGEPCDGTPPPPTPKKKR